MDSDRFRIFKNTDKKSEDNLALIGLFLTLVIFLSDIFLPPNIHPEFLYSVILLLTIWLPGLQITFNSGIGMTGLVILGYFIHARTASEIDIPSRVMSILAIWASVYAIIRYKESEETMLRSQERLRAMFENATEGIIVSNQKGEIVMANPRAYEQFGCKAEHELVGQMIESLVPTRFVGKHAHHREFFYSHLHSRAMGKGMSLFAKKQDGTEFPVEISLSFFKIKNENFVISFIIDITERRKQEELIQKSQQELEQRVAERTQELKEVNTNLKTEMDERVKIEDALRDSERLYSTIARNFPGGIIAVLNSELKYIFVDGKELKEISRGKEDFIGKKVDEIFFIGDSELVNNLKKVFEWQSVSFEMEFKKGHYFVNAVPLPDTRGVIREILLVIQNVSEQKKAEREITAALQKERELGELKSKFVTTASHEFRTPLSTVLSSVNLIEHYNTAPEAVKVRKHIDRIKSSVKNLTDILNDFLSLEKLEAGKIDVHLDPLDLHAFIKELCEELQMVTKPGQNIIYTHEGETTEAKLDKQLLRNVMINLINNAIKYSEENKIIEIRSKIDTSEVSISVKDDGIGIPPEDQVHLFERFFRAQNASSIQGTGLGLNIVRRYVKLMNGEITFFSEFNKGSIFTLRFKI